MGIAGVSSEAKQGDVVITSDTGSKVVLADGTVNGQWAYLEQQVVTSIFPSSGQVDTTVTISGSGMLGGGKIDRVILGSIAAKDILRATDTEIVVKTADVHVDANTSKNLHDITVIADSGALVTASKKWKYVEKGVILDVSPGEGHGG